MFRAVLKFQVFRARFLFRAWVSVWVCVSGMGFALGLCFDLIFLLSFLFFVSGFDGHDGVVAVQ